VELIEAMRDQFLARIDAEGQAKIAQQIAEAAGDGDGELGQMMKLLAPIIAAKMQAGQSAPPQTEKVKRKRAAKPLGAVDP
jgi:uncharacterized protein YqeY